MNTRGLLWAVAVILAGCVSPAEQKAADEAQCRGYGYTDGTDAFANCLMTTANRRADQQCKWDEERMKNFEASQQKQQTQAAPAASQPAEPTKVNCTSTETTSTAGNTTATHTSTNCSSR